MSQNYFQFPSWVVAELNKQAQPKGMIAQTPAPAGYIQPSTTLTTTSEGASLITREMVWRDWQALGIGDRDLADQAFDHASIDDLRGSLAAFATKYMPTTAEYPHAPTRRKGRPAGSKNKPKPSTVRKLDTK